MNILQEIYEELNPHIHYLITEGGFSDDGFWRVVKHFNYTLLRKSFRPLCLMRWKRKSVPLSGKSKLLLNRIDSYDSENVTFHYNHHEDNVFVRKTVPALNFISLLTQHIPGLHYKMTRSVVLTTNAQCH